MTQNNSFELLVKLTDTFRYRGWVNGLNRKQYDALNKADEYINKVKNMRKRKEDHPAIAQALREQGHTIREIASILRYAHPGSITHLLQKANSTC